MASRLNLHSDLKDILGSENVYFQPPESVKMQYPAIVYKLDGIKKRNADDVTYKTAKRYQLVLIDEDPDSEFISSIMTIPSSKFINHFAKDNLNHYIFEIYY